MTTAVLEPSQAAEPHDRLLARSFRHCRLVTRRQAQNFYYGLKLTPEPKRTALCVIYAWMRAVDDLADEGGSVSEKIARLEAFRRYTGAAVDLEQNLPEAAVDRVLADHDLIWPALRKIVLGYRIPVEYLHAMIDGQLLDQNQTRYATFEQLYDYCYKVASVVGLVCITIWGYTGGEATRKLAEHRGIALQLTNILRDLVEDARRDRVYLPADELEWAGFDPARFSRWVLQADADAAFDRLMADQLARAHSYYELSAGLEDHLEPDCRATCWAMMRIYHRLLEKMSRRPRAVLTSRVRLSKLEKISIGARAAWGRWS